MMMMMMMMSIVRMKLSFSLSLSLFSLSLEMIVSSDTTSYQDKIVEVPYTYIHTYIDRYIHT